MPELPEVDPEQILPHVVVSVHTRGGRLYGARTIKDNIGELYARVTRG